MEVEHRLELGRRRDEAVRRLHDPDYLDPELLHEAGVAVVHRDDACDSLA
jgi:hypothetical protein